MVLMLLPLVVLALSALLVVGIGARRYWALYLLDGLYLIGLLYAAYLTFLVWQDSGYGENWAMYGMLFFVWPYSALVSILGGIEIALLWRDPHPHARRCRRLTAVIVAVLVGLSVSPVVLG
ncbi:hypothetical protein G3480_26830 [Thiorhodococcus mannitoliphagus]|uniref:Uncharacterized protein n=1 Tax=Thiorhodococcus mannitoliphagus TaxID=329406 RepID=A0A6P1DZU2_9GAMM|nr:hypothetical protein [Thiorhodococcus mannitoliphagus]NEX23827.1 hypothetical protein [Thiorhodococcus mannitoliphagus]